MTVVRPSSSMITVVPRSSPAGRHGDDVQPFGVEQVDGDAAEAAGERADEAGRGAECDALPGTR